MDEEQRQGGSRRGPGDRSSDGSADGADGPGATEPDGVGPAEARTPVTQQIGRGVVLVLVVLFGVFAATNAQPVDFSWVFGGTEVTDGPGDATDGGVPLIVLLLVSFVVGAVAGGALVWQTGRNRRRSRTADTDADRHR